MKSSSDKRPILLTTRYEPMPLWHFVGRKWFLSLYFRPADVGVGFQPMWGGVALHLWPLMFAICNHHKMPSGPCDSDGSPKGEDADAASFTTARAAGIAEPSPDRGNQASEVMA